MLFMRVVADLVKVGYQQRETHPRGREGDKNNSRSKVVQCRRRINVDNLPEAVPFAHPVKCKFTGGHGQE